MQRMYNEPLIITGCPKSGTTALLASVVLFPDCRVSYETGVHVFPHPVRRLRERLHTFQTEVWRPQWGGQQAFAAAVETAEQKGLAAALHDLYKDAVVYGDKMPIMQSHNVASIVARWPKARIVMCIRDGRDFIASSMRHHDLEGPAHPWICPTPNAAQHIWLDVMRTWSEQKPLLARDGTRYIELRYEEAMQNPQAALRNVAQFAGLNPTDEQVMHAAQDYKPTNLGYWRDRIPDVENQINEEMRDMLRRWGYMP